MRIFLPLTFVLALGVWAQTTSQQGPSPETVEKMKAAAKEAVESGKSGVQPAAPQQPKRTIEVTVPAENVMPIQALPPATLVATVDGQKVTAGDLQAVLQALPQQVQQQAQANRRQFVEQYGLLRRLTEEAKKDGLDQQSPWKQAIEYGTMRVLYQARISKKFDEISVPVDEIKKTYDSNPDRYQQAHVRAIYLPFNSAPVSQADSAGKKILTETEAKAKAEDLSKQARTPGTDFIKLVKENSGDAASAAKDGDYGFIKKTDAIPPELKNAIFGAKAGEIVGPIRQANGFYVFRIEEIGPQPFDQVQVTITNELKNARFQEWLSGLQKTIDVKLETLPVTMKQTGPKGAASGTVTPAPAAPQPSAPAKQ